MPRALHTPYDEGNAEAVGRKLFRKQLLPVGSIEYEGQRLDFSREYLADLAKSFNAGTFDQVPFLLADAENRHHSDPEKFRGEVKGFELGDDGLYSLIELTDDGAKAVRDNPKLGVSARIVEGIERGGQQIGRAVQHVLGTLDPKVTGMNPWEPVELSEPNDLEVVDLIGESYGEASGPEPTSSSPAVSAPSDTTDLTAEDANRIVAGLLESAREDEKEPVTLSEEDRQAIELAQSRAESAQSAAAEARRELAEERFDRKRSELLHAGVPPKLVELAEPVLRGDAKVIELANGEKRDAAGIVEAILNEYRGVVNLSEVGVREGEDDGRDPAVRSWVKGEE